MSENTVTVYSNPGCVQCNATYRAMDKKGLSFTVDDALEATNNALLKELGHQQAPGVIVRDAQGEIVDHWSGFRPDKVSQHAPAAADLVAA